MALTRRRFLRYTAGGAVLSAWPATAARKPTRRPNLLWIMTDQQPVGTIRAYGNAVIKTPNLDRIAAEGMRFDRFFISSFPCGPSRATLLTGRYAHSHGVVQNDVLLAKDIPSLGTILKQAGYTTGYVGKWHLGGHMYRNVPGRKPFDGCWCWRRIDDPRGFRFEKVRGGTGEDLPAHGFESWCGGFKHYQAYLRKVGLGRMVEQRPTLGNHNIAPSGPEGTHIFSRVPAEHHVSAFLAGRAAAFLDAQKGSSRPFCLVLSFYGPHLPVAPPKPWDQMYPLEKVPLPANHRDELTNKPRAQRNNRRIYRLPDWTDQQFRDYIRRYWGYCSFIDAQIGRVLEALDRTGRADETIVLFTSDHGDMIGAHGMVFKLTHCGYEELLRVPFLLRYPARIRPNAVCESLVASVDVLPTLLELMGITPPAGVQGRSFAGLLRRPDADFRDQIVCNSGERNLTLRTRRYKFVLNHTPRDLDELYDLERDPGELTNRIADAEYASVLADMKSRLAKWLDATGHPYAAVIRKALTQPAPRGPARPGRAVPSAPAVRPGGA